jgi:hypothetical protein
MKSSPTTARSSPAGSAPPGRGAVRPYLPPARHHPLCTGVPSPTTTGKIERFHQTLRAELLTGHRFDSLAQAQQLLDVWSPTTTSTGPTRPSPWPSQPNAPATDRPDGPGPSRPGPPAAHRGPDRDHPAGVGQRPHRGLLPAGLSRPAPHRPSRHRPAPPQHHAGVLRRPAIRTVPRRSAKEVVQIRAHRPTSRDDPRPPRELSTITRNQTGKHQPELDRSRKRLATLATASRRTPGVTWL